MRTADAEDKWEDKGGQKFVLAPTAEYDGKGRLIEKVETNSGEA